MRIARVLAVLIPVLVFAADDSTKAKNGWLEPYADSTWAKSGWPIAHADSTETKNGWMGVYTDELTKPMLVALNIGHGVLVTDVADGSPADKAGLEAGDVITSLDGEDMSDGSALRWAVRDRPNKKVVVSIRRRCKDRKLDVTLGTREGTEQTFNFEWPAIPREALREAKRALREVGPSLRKQLEHSDVTLDSLRQEILEMKGELRELRRKMTERQKTE